MGFCKLYRGKPVFCYVITPFNMDMRRLVSFKAVEEKPITRDLNNSWHRYLSINNRISSTDEWRYLQKFSPSWLIAKPLGLSMGAVPAALASSRRAP